MQAVPFRSFRCTTCFPSVDFHKALTRYWISFCCHLKVARVSGSPAKIWEQTLENQSIATPSDNGVASILAALEEQLGALDRIGAHIAAAHLDAAIQQLRLKQANAH